MAVSLGDERSHPVDRRGTYAHRMPIMSRVEGTFCRTHLWNVIAAKKMLPWAVGAEPLTGRVLEIGGGAGAMAEAALDAYDIDLTVTDLDPRMVSAARERLGDRGTAEVADVTALPYDAGTYDTVTSYLMLHHVIHWPAAITEAARVLSPGGTFRGYDLTDTAAARWFHRVDRSPFLMVAPEDLQDQLESAGFGDVRIEQAAAGHLMRFSATR
jgi:SAM-dependent methyltransferase